MMQRVSSFRPVLIGVASATAVLAIALSRPVQAVSAALVSVTNSSANPVPVVPTDDRITQPFATRVFPTGQFYASIPVPAGKRLVLTSVTGFNNGDGSISDLEVVLTTAGNVTAMRIPFGAPPSPTSYRYLQNYNAFLVADPGTTVYFDIDDSKLQDYAGVNIDVRGYWVSAS